jgi:UPF0271 protein
MGPVLLNVDAGEYPDEPEALFELAHFVSIACGGHAGDASSMDRALSLAKRFGTKVGAHPSFADREGFGRRALTVAPDVLEESVATQVRALSVCAERAAVPLLYVKPHGALYHGADRDDVLAEAVVLGALKALPRFTVVGRDGGGLSRAARSHGLPFAREGFADRAVRADGSLVPRGEAGAMVTDPDIAASRAGELARSGTVDTVCVHADTQGSLAIARAVRRELDAVARS